MKTGKIIVLSGPSGVGKGTILKEFINDPELNLTYSVSMTTRKQREGEINNVNYIFVSHSEFQDAINNDEMLEYAEFVGNYYGTPLKNVEELLQQGKNVILEIEVQGYKQVMQKRPDAIGIFIKPPSMEELENRIRGRGTEPEEIVQQRLSKAQKEMEEIATYKYVVLNDDVKLAADIIRQIIKHNIER